MRVLLAFLLGSFSLFASGELSGRRAPGFSLVDSESRQHDPQDYRGKILLIEFMQTTCPHCAAFSDLLEEVPAKYSGKVAVLSIAVYPDPPANITRYVAAHKLRVPVLFDCGQVAASYYKATARNPTIHFPHLFIVDGQGMIRNDYEYGILTRDIFEGRALFTELDRMLAAESRSGATTLPVKKPKQ